MAGFSDERVRAILQGRRNVRVYPLPFARDVEVGVRVLADHEFDSARVEAQGYAKKIRADLEIDPDFLEREARRQIIWRAFVDPADHTRPFFPSDKDVRELDSEILRALFELYYEHQAWCSPLRHLSQDQAKELADALGKAPEPRALLVDFDSDSLRSLCISLASALRSISQQSSSSGQG